MSCQLLELDELKCEHSRPTAFFQRRIRLAWDAKRLFIYCANRVARALTGRPKGGMGSVDDAEFREGDLVRVRSRKEIKQTLDAWGTYKGCTFIPEMYAYCEREFRVLKKVEYFYDEVKQKGCRCRGVVFLEDATCSGEREMFPHPCDRNCFLFWRTVWLEKI